MKHFRRSNSGQARSPSLMCLRLVCCRSLLRFVSYAAQVVGQFLVYTGAYMLRALGDTEEQPSPKPSTKGWFM